MRQVRPLYLEHHSFWRYTTDSLLTQRRSEAFVSQNSNLECLALLKSAAAVGRLEGTVIQLRQPLLQLRELFRLRCTQVVLFVDIRRQMKQATTRWAARVWNACRWRTVMGAVRIVTRATVYRRAWWTTRYSAVAHRPNWPRPLPTSAIRVSWMLATLWGKALCAILGHEFPTMADQCGRRQWNLGSWW